MLFEVSMLLAVPLEAPRERTKDLGPAATTFAFIGGKPIIELLASALCRWGFTLTF